jgi:2-methylcitrate dehydratase PrpD
MTGLTQALGNYVANPSFAGKEPEACEVAKTGFIDTIATMIAGSSEPVVQIVQQFFNQGQSVGQTDGQRAGQAPIPFAGNYRPAQQAAFINAVAGHALDYDDVALSGHPSTVLVPAILAEGYVLQSSGRDALSAYVIGYEVWAELFKREADQYHLKGWHPTGVLGAVACAAAVAYLHRLDADLSARALAIAASMASGLVANFGTMTKPFHAGRAASHGIDAVRLAKLGMTSSPDAFEHHAGYLAALSPAGRVDRASDASSLGQAPRILESGLSIKRYPVCYSCHRTIDGVLEIANRENLKATDIKSMHLTTGAAQASMLRNHHPKTGLEAKFSAEFAIASAIVAREVGLSQLTDEFVTREDVSSLYDKLTVSITDKSCPIDPSFALTDRIVIETVAGKTFDSGEIRFPLGNAMNPIDAVGLKQKFDDCVLTGQTNNPSLKGIDSDLYQRIAALESLPNIRQLFQAT